MNTSSIRSLAGLLVAICILGPVAIQASDAPANFLRNPGFEAGRYGWAFNARPFDASFDVAEKTETTDGRMAGRITMGPDCHIASLGSEWYPLNAGQDYVFSVYLRSANGNIPVTISVWSWAEAGGTWNTKTESRQAVEVSEIWQRFSVRANLKEARAGKYQALIEMREPGELMIDAAMLEAGTTANSFHAGSEFDLGLESSERGLLYNAGDNVKITSRIHNRSGAERDVNLEYSITDFDDQEVLSGSLPLRISPDQSIEQPLDLALNRKGYFKLTAWLTDPDRETLGDAVLGFAVIDKNRSRQVNKDSPFGVSLSPNNLEIQLERAKAIGVEHLRVHEDFTWRAFEPEEGIYRWPDSMKGEAVSTATSHESTAYDHPFYGSAAYDYRIFKESGFDPLVYIQHRYPEWTSNVSAEQTLMAYGDFYRELASHYKGTFEKFSVINEPWHNLSAAEYLDILKATYAKAKEGNPDAVMVGVTGYHGPQLDFLKEIIDLGALEYMDVLALHAYPRPESPEPALPDFIKLTREWMREKGKEVPLWITEMGWTSQGLELLPTRIPRPEQRNNKDTEQAKFMVRSNILSIANGVDLVHWFHFSGDNTWRYTYHMFESDSPNSVMKTIPAYSAMSRMLANAEFQRTLAEGDGGQYAYLFSDGDKRIITAWTTSPQDTLFLKTPAGVSFEIYDIMGNQLDAVTGKGGLEAVAISDAVVYLVSRDPSFEAAEVTGCLSANILPSPGGKPNEYSAHVRLTNIWSGDVETRVQLTLPPGLGPASEDPKSFRIKAGQAAGISLPFTVETDADSVTEYIFVRAETKTDDGRIHRLQARERFMHNRPLPKPPGGVWIEAEDPQQINFEPAHAWLPSQFRSYGGDNLKFRSTRPVTEKQEFLAEYEFVVKEAGDYFLMAACSPFGGDTSVGSLPTLSYRLNDGNLVSAHGAPETGPAWIYTTHRNVWWRFHNVWHDLGPIRLQAGPNRLMLRFGSPAPADYNYFTIDALAILNEAQKQQFQSVLKSRDF